MQTIGRHATRVGPVPNPDPSDAFQPLGRDPVTGYLYRVEDRLVPVPIRTTDLEPGRYVIVPEDSDGGGSEPREIHFDGARKLALLSSFWLSVLCVDAGDLYVLGRREQVLHDGLIRAHVREELFQRFPFWLSYCWRSASYRYAISTPAGVPVGSGRIELHLPSEPRCNDTDFPRVQNELVSRATEQILQTVLTWERKTTPNLLSMILSRIPSVVTGTQMFVPTPVVGIAGPPVGWASWGASEDEDFLARFGGAWMRGSPITCGKVWR